MFSYSLWWHTHTHTYIYIYIKFFFGGVIWACANVGFGANMFKHIFPIFPVKYCDLFDQFNQFNPISPSKIPRNMLWIPRKRGISSCFPWICRPTASQLLQQRHHGAGLSGARRALQQVTAPRGRTAVLSSPSNKKMLVGGLYTVNNG